MTDSEMETQAADLKQVFLRRCADHSKQPNASTISGHLFWAKHEKVFKLNCSYAHDEAMHNGRMKGGNGHLLKIKPMGELPEIEAIVLAVAGKEFSAELKEFRDGYFEFYLIPRAS